MSRRLPFASTTHLGKGTLSVTASSSSRTRAEASKLTAPALSSPEAVLSVVASALVKMRANLEEVPYTFQSEGGPWAWAFSPLYATLGACVGPAAELWAVWQLPRCDRASGLEVSVCLVQRDRATAGAGRGVWPWVRRQVCIDETQQHR